MIRLILLSDFTESFSYNLLKGVLMYANSHEPWVVCRMPLSYKQTYGIKGVLKWAKTWHADAIIGRFDNDDNVEIFRENGIIAIAQDYKARFSNIPYDRRPDQTSLEIITKLAGWQRNSF